MSSKLNKDVQAKYEECILILENLHNAIALVLSLTDEYDNKTPTELVQFALDNYIEFENLSPTEKLKLEAETEVLLDEIQKINPEIEVIDNRKTTKKELLN